LLESLIRYKIFDLIGEVLIEGPGHIFIVLLIGYTHPGFCPIWNVKFSHLDENEKTA
jgi:hypothetical protein